MKFIKWLISFISKGLNDNITVYAAQAAFYLVLSAIPLIMIILSAVNLFLPLESAEVLKFLPFTLTSQMQDFLSGILSEISGNSHIPLISVSAVTTLWSASRGFAATERGIKAIYRIPKRKFFIANILVSFVYTILFTAVLLVSLGLLVFGKTIFSFINNALPGIELNLSILEFAFLYVFLFFFFALCYVAFSSRKIPFRYQLPGALFSLSGWVLFSYLFSVYINNFANYSRIYGSLTAIILFMLWLYSCMVILLFGAKINMEIITYKVSNERKK